MKANSATARYLILANDLRDQIANGTLKPGDRFPSETVLSRQYGYSRGTVVKAVELLVSEGLVNRRQGSGSYVSGRALHRRAAKLLSFSDTVREDGHKTSQKLLELASADPATANEFGVTPPAMEIRRLRLVDDNPCAIHRSIVPQSVFGRLFSSNTFAQETMSNPDFSLYQRLEQNGLRVNEARERVTARIMTPHEADLLEASRGDPAIVVFRVSYSQNGELLEAVEAAYRADFYTYDTHLVRGPQATDTGLRIAATSEGFANDQPAENVRETS